MTWKQYQEEAAELFRQMGLEAKTNVTIQGVRTRHAIDVLVKSRYVGFEITWIVECKHWKKPVNKLHVLALRDIVTDTGADRGILLSESGFQRGAPEAAKLTNVQLTSLSAVRTQCVGDINAMRLMELFDVVSVCKEKYWDLPKEFRIEHGLRPEVGDLGYSSTRVIESSETLLSRAFRGIYPIELDPFECTLSPERVLPERISSSEELVALLEPLISELEVKIEEASKAFSPPQQEPPSP
jgi:hypothetical protein